jgi:hypothetical protein
MASFQYIGANIVSAREGIRIEVDAASVPGRLAIPRGKLASWTTVRISERPPRELNPDLGLPWNYASKG